MTATTSQPPSSQSDLQGEFRADPGAHLPTILVCAVIAVLCVVGVVWGIIRPGANAVGAVFLALVLGPLAVVCVGVAVFLWLRMQRRIGLALGGLAYFDGRQSHQIAWADVQEIYEEVSSVKMLGITVDSPKLGVAVVTKAGVRCEVDQNIRGYETLSPLVAREVHRELGQRVRGQLAARQGARFGPVLVSHEGVRIEQPVERPWWDTLKERLEGQTPARVAVPGQHGWKDVVIRIAPAMQGDKLSNHTTYNELQIFARGRDDRVFACPIPLFPNFAEFVDVLGELKQPLRRPGEN
jgi:hypothetical protein